MVPSSSCANLHFPLSRCVFVILLVASEAEPSCVSSAGRPHLQAVEQSLTWVQSDDYSATT